MSVIYYHVPNKKPCCGIERVACAVLLHHQTVRKHHSVDNKVLLLVQHKRIQLLLQYYQQSINRSWQEIPAYRHETRFFRRKNQSKSSCVIVVHHFQLFPITAIQTPLSATLLGQLLRHHTISLEWKICARMKQHTNGSSTSLVVVDRRNDCHHHTWEESRTPSSWQHCRRREVSVLFHGHTSRIVLIAVGKGGLKTYFGWL